MHVEPFLTDDDHARHAYGEIAARLDALPRDALCPPPPDVLGVAHSVLRVAADVTRPAVRSRFARLPADEFSVVCVDQLGTTARGAAFAKSMHLGASSRGGESRLPLMLVQRAGVLKARMMKLATYHFEDDLQVGAEVESIRLGSGYLDLASDLSRLARLYTVHRAQIERDPKHYRAADEGDAAALAAEIVRALDGNPNADERAWADRLTRAWTLLKITYEEVQAAGLFIFRGEGALARFPPLASLAHRPARRSDEEHTATTEVAPPEEGTAPSASLTR